MRIWLMAAVVALTTGAGPLLAQGRTMTLLADASLEASGLLSYLVPRFALKTGVRVTVLAHDAADLPGLAGAGEGDALVGEADLARALAENGAGQGLRAAFHTKDDAEGGAFSALVLTGAANAEHAARFIDWLTSDIGQRTVASFPAEGGVAYVPGAVEVVVAEVFIPEGDPDEGEKLAHFHCGRCHVVSERNRFGGIGSTPSFAAMRNLEDWDARFMGFWSLNPHPSFTQVEGITDPFDPARPPHIAPVVITEDELAAIVAFTATIEPKNLGAQIESR